MPKRNEDDTGDDESEDELFNQVARDQIFVNNLEYILELDNHGDHGDNEILQEDHPTPRGFIAVIRNSTRYYVRKSSILWMLETKAKKISTDRLLRFIPDKKVNNDDHIMCGDFVFMRSDTRGRDRLCQVLGFKFLSGNPKFSSISCPISVKKENARGVSVLCNFFTVQNKVLTVAKTAPDYINIDNFKKHVILKRDLHTNDLFIV